MEIETFHGVAYPWMIDQAGHMISWRQSEMFDVAGYHFFHEIGVPVDQSGDFILADVKQELEFL
jgi:acyl-CoA thioester hydrolase